MARSGAARSGFDDKGLGWLDWPACSCPECRWMEQGFFRCGAGYGGRDSFRGFCSPEPLRGLKGDGASGSNKGRGCRITVQSDPIITSQAMNDLLEFLRT